MIVPTSYAATAARIVVGPPARHLAQRTCAGIARAVVGQAGTPSSTALSALPAAAVTMTSETLKAVAIRGGAAAVAAALDMGRAKTRLEGLQSYTVVTALVMNSALRIFSATPMEITAQDSKIDIWAKSLFVVFCGLSIVAGSYTTVVYTLLGLYSKTALGLGKDEAFTEFFARTMHLRSNGFACFLTALVCFNISFALTLFLKFKGKQRWYASGVAAVLMIMSFHSWWSIMGIAKEVIFT